MDFARRKLKVGGVLYVSYNTFPGWTTLAPMRDLMLQHTETLGARGRGMPSLIGDALKFARELVETKPLFEQANPQVADKLEKLSEKNPHYLAHEYFNRDWAPMNFAAMARWLEPPRWTSPVRPVTWTSSTASTSPMNKESSSTRSPTPCCGTRSGM